MSLTYQVVSKRPGGVAGERQPKYYPAITDRSTIDLREVCERIASRSTFSAADVMGVVQSFVELVPDLLQDGYNVRLDGFGTFSLHVKGKGKDSPEEVTQHDITGVKMAFLPDAQIKRQLTATKFEKKRR